jgi:hypothetical protein
VQQFVLSLCKISKTNRAKIKDFLNQPVGINNNMKPVRERRIIIGLAKWWSFKIVNFIVYAVHFGN